MKMHAQNKWAALSAVFILLAFMLSGPAGGDGLVAMDYGYTVKSDGECAVWWAEGAYKIMQDDPIPEKSSDEVVLSCARNEYEPFQLVLVPNKRIEGVRIGVSPFRNTSGKEIAENNISILQVGYVNITIPTDEYGGKGWYPDPLPPCDGPFTIYPGQNNPLWITVRVPAGAEAGTYRGTVKVAFENREIEIPVRIEVWPFELPEKASIRSSFALMNHYLKKYHNLETDEELRTVADLYMQNMKEHRVAATSPLDLYPMKVNITGVPWEGAFFVSDIVHGGKRALAVDDNSVAENAAAVSKDLIPVRPSIPYVLSWFARTEVDEADYSVLITCYDADGKFLPAHSKLKVFPGTSIWKRGESIVEFMPEVKAIRIHLFATFRDERGSKTGTTYFDDIVFREQAGDENLLPGGDCEMELADMTVEVDFAEFDKGARRYLDEFGFNSFNLELRGLGGGTFHSRQGGAFAGFLQGSPEYEKLMSDYFRQVQDHLEANGWLGKEYIYWFDEPQAKDYEFVREGMKSIRKAASKLTRFITENAPGPEIMDVSEISCLAVRKINPEFISEQVANGEEFWSYLSTGTRRKWISLFTDHPAVDMRIWLWISYRFQLKGILIWCVNYWSSDTVFPPELLQNPWEEPMSYRVGYGTPYGQVNNWGNGDGRFLYPPNRDPGNDKQKYIEGPINSVRWEIMREGIEDYEYFCLLKSLVDKAPSGKQDLAQKASGLLNFPDTIFRSAEEYTKDPQVLLDYRKRIAEMIVLLQ